MFRSVMTTIRELYLYLTKVIFMLKYSVKLRRFIYIYINSVGISALPCVATRAD